MKKLLITSSALVAVAFAGQAQAADPIKLSIGGFGAFAVGMASQDSAFASSGAAGTDYQNWDVKGNNEVHFKGATTLDNGLDVSVKYELEAGGRSVVADAADEWNITVGSSFGTFIFGAEDAATVLIAKGHKDVSGAMNGFDEGDAIAGSWIVRPGAVTRLTSTYINTAGDAEKINYISPTFAGFTFGATAVPSLDDTGGDTSAMPTNSVEDVFGVGAMWNGEFSGATIGVEAGYVVAEHNGFDDYNEWQAGASVGMAGFTVGGAYRKVNTDAIGVVAVGDDLDQDAWELGVAYETGPYGVSLGYFKTTADEVSGAAVVDDETTMWQLSGSYAMGPGIALKLSGGVIDFEDGSTTSAATPANHNDGTYMMTGMTLAF